MYIGKTLPHSTEAEQGALGSMLVAPKTVIPECVTKVTGDYFHVPQNQSVYIYLIELWQEGKDIDLITFTQFLRDKGVLESVGGAAFVTSLFTLVPSGALVGHYLEILREKYLLRQLIEAGTEAVRKAYDDQEDPDSLVFSTQEKIQSITRDDRFKKERVSFKDRLMEKMERMENGEPNDDIIKTGIEGLDRYSPLALGDQPLIVGERKDGKSVLAATISANIVNNGGRGIYFSLESPSSEVIDRLFAGQARIVHGFHHVKRMLPEEMEKATRSITRMSDWKFDVYDDIYDLPAIIGEIRQQKSIHPDLQFAVVDYAQLVRPCIKGEGNREQEVATVSRGLRLVGMETKVAILLVSQLNDNRKSRESRALENDTTACWELLRDEDTPNERTLSIPYQRKGESGVGFQVAFLGNLTRIENLAKL